MLKSEGVEMGSEFLKIKNTMRSTVIFTTRMYFHSI
jgi:hypothetical protein